jgi:hypothetical protein
MKDLIPKINNILDFFYGEDNEISEIGLSLFVFNA